MSDNRAALAALAAGIALEDTDTRNAIILAVAFAVFVGYQILKYGVDRFLRETIDFLVSIPFWWIDQLVGVARVVIEELIPNLVTTTVDVISGAQWFDMRTLEIPNLFLPQ